MTDPFEDAFDTIWWAHHPDLSPQASRLLLRLPAADQRIVGAAMIAQMNEEQRAAARAREGTKGAATSNATKAELAAELTELALRLKDERERRRGRPFGNKSEAAKAIRVDFVRQANEVREAYGLESTGFTDRTIRRYLGGK